MVRNDTATVNDGESAFINVLNNDSDPDGDELSIVRPAPGETLTADPPLGTVRITSAPGNSTDHINFDTSEDATLLALDEGETETVTITYFVTDGRAQIQSTLNVTINGVDTPPTLEIHGSLGGNPLNGNQANSNDVIDINPTEELRLTLQGSDPDDTVLSYELGRSETFGFVTPGTLTGNTYVWVPTAADIGSNILWFSVISGTGEDAVTTSARVRTNVIVTPPVIENFNVVNSTTIKLVASEDLLGTPSGAGGFTVTGASTAVTVTNVNVDGRIITLTLSGAVPSGSTLTVAYSPTTDRLTDRFGVVLEDFTESNIPYTDTTRPTITSLRVTAADTVELVASEPLAEPSAAPAGFTVTANGQSATVTSATLSNLNVITITFDGVIPNGDTATVDHDGSNAITDINDNNLAVSTNQVTSNLDTGLPPFAIVTVKTPTVINFSRGEPVFAPESAKPSLSDFEVTVIRQGTVTLPIAEIQTASTTRTASDITITLESDHRIQENELVTVRFTPGSNSLYDVDGNSIGTTGAPTTSKIDAKFPLIISAEFTDTDTVTLTADENLADLTSDGSSGFTVSGNTVTRVVVSGDTITLTLSTPITDETVATFSYDMATGDILDDGNNSNPLESITEMPITNNLDTTPPEITDASFTGGMTISLTANEDLADLTSDGPSGFTVSNNTVGRAVASGDTITLTLLMPAEDGVTATLSYDPAQGGIGDIAGNPLGAVTNLDVPNELDTTPPEITLVEFQVAPGSREMGSNILVIRTSETLAGFDADAPSGFAVSGNTITNVRAGTVSTNGDTFSPYYLDAVTLALEERVPDNSTVSLSYDPAQGSIGDIAGNPLPAITSRDVHNEHDTTQPRILNIEFTAPDVMVLAASEYISSLDTAEDSGFTVSDNTILRTVAAGMSVTLMLSEEVQEDTSVSITYVHPDSGGITDAGGLPLENFDRQETINLVPAQPVHVREAIPVLVGGAHLERNPDAYNCQWIDARLSPDDGGDDFVHYIDTRPSLDPDTASSEPIMIPADLEQGNHTVGLLANPVEDEIPFVVVDSICDEITELLEESHVPDPRARAVRLPGAQIDDDLVLPENTLGFYPGEFSFPGTIERVQWRIGDGDPTETPYQEGLATLRLPGILMAGLNVLTVHPLDSEGMLATADGRPITLHLVIDGPLVSTSAGKHDHKSRPTFGLSHATGAQLVTGGFSFNNQTIDITDNWHTDFELANSTIGDSNTVTLKAHHAHVLKSITLSLGIPEIGELYDAETAITLVLARNYSSTDGYEITDIVHDQDEPLIDEAETTATVYAVECRPGDAEKSCTGFEIIFVTQAPLRSNIMAISAIDSKNRIATTYVNEGVELVGEAILEPATHEIIVRHSNQGSPEIITLVQQDRRYDTWMDQHGNLWEQNSYGTWKQLTIPGIPELRDDPTGVMNRMHSEFDSAIAGEIKLAESLRDAKFAGVYDGSD